jgi:DNA-binding NarL/FixJ family response regulator
MIRIAVLDDHPAVLGGLQRLAERVPDLEPVAFVETEEALRRALDQRLADVVVWTMTSHAGTDLPFASGSRSTARHRGS